MRKFIFVMAALAAMVMNAHTVEQKFYDNTYVTLKGGVTALMHPGCNGYENLGHTFEAATGLEIGKWITPNWGLSIDGTNGWTNGSKVGHFQDKYAVNYLTVSALGKYRFMPMNKFNIALAAGPMWIHGFKKDAQDANDMGAKMRIEFNYNFTNHLAMQVAPELNYNMRHTNDPTWIPTKHLDQPYFDSRRAWYGIMVGVTYKMGNEFTVCDYKYTQADIDALNAEINTLRSRTPVERVVEKTIVKNVADEYVIFFDKNRSILSKEAKNTLDKITGTVVIQGHASEEGTYARNEILSKERATVVADYLKARGVKVLGAEGMGATGSRVAIIKIQ